MISKRRVTVTFGFLVLCLVAGVMFWKGQGTKGPSDQLSHHGIEGPKAASQLPQKPSRVSPVAYARGPATAVALYVNDTAASWLGLVHGLRAIGVPLRVVTDLDEALKHRVVFAYPSLTGANTTPEQARKWEGHLDAGGTLVAFVAVGGWAAHVFGFTRGDEERGLRTLRFSGEDVTRILKNDDAERLVPLAGKSDGATGLPGVRYHGTSRPPLALYGDGGAAMVHATRGRGHAYAIGFDLGHYILRAHGGRFSGETDAYVNTYQPKVDGFLRLLREIYRRGEPEAILVHPVPHNHAVTVLLTHDIDFTRSMNNVLAYAEDETSMGVPATYFIQAKYVKDYNDDLFLDISRRPILQRLSELGMEIASHTIAHSNEFRNMELGSGRESYPDYQPFVKTFDETHGGTIAGELRVSKYLLESLSDQTVTSFRPGHLSLPQALPQMLAATGYSYSSSITANEALTHFPYRMMFDRSYDAPVPVFEIPVTIEDEQGTLGNRVGDAVELSRRIAAYGGVVNILIHTDILDHKLEFQRRYIKAVKDIAWFGTMRGFGDWWVARDGLQLDVAEVQGQPGSRVIRLQSASRLEGLTLEVPKGWQLASGPAGTTQSGNRIVVGDFGEDSKAGTLHFRVP